MTWPVATIMALGVWHGLNPGMGWLFAVALGMQEQSRRHVWRALIPLVGGHALAIAAALTGLVIIGAVVPPQILKWGLGMVLVASGVNRIIGGRHPRYGGMRMTMRKLTVWSFLMASAHGAGLMVLPFVLAQPEAAYPVAADATAMVAVSGAPPLSVERADSRRIPGEEVRYRRARSRGQHVAGGHHVAGPGDGGGTAAWLVLLVHSAGYLLATGLLAVLVYEKFGLRMIRKAWLNLDLIWGIALAATGVIAPFL